MDDRQRLMASRSRQRRENTHERRIAVTYAQRAISYLAKINTTDRELEAKVGTIIIELSELIEAINRL